MKLPICFAVALVFVGHGFASPKTYTHSPAIVEKNALPAQFDSTVSSIFGNAVWTFEHLAEIVRSIVKTNVVNIASWALDISMRMEFLVMADGSHLMFPHSGHVEVENNHKVIAIAVSKLLQNLKTIEHANEVVRNVSRVVLSTKSEIRPYSLDDVSVKEMMVTLLREYFKTMDQLFVGDHELAGEYSKQKVAATEVVKHDPKMDDAFVKTWEHQTHQPIERSAVFSFLENKPVFCQAFANKLFLKQGVKNVMMIFNATYYERYILAQALLTKAKSSEFDSRVNQVYHKALKRAGATQQLEHSEFVIADVLFDAIVSGVASDPALHQEVATLKHEIASKTTYDIDVLSVDLSPL